MSVYSAFSSSAEETYRLLPSSSAYIRCKTGKKTRTYHFTGVTSIEHSLSLSIEKTSSQGSDLVNGARNQPCRVTLNIVETDTENPEGSAKEFLDRLASIKKKRVHCTVVTSLATYKKMLLSDISVTQDGTDICGWTGKLTFAEHITSGSGKSGKKSKKKNNSSTRTNTGTSNLSGASGGEKPWILTAG